MRGLTNRRSDCVNWDWASGEDMISSPSASLCELARQVRPTSAYPSGEGSYLAPETSGLAYMRSPLSRKDWVSCSANACTPRVASWLGLMGVNDGFRIAIPAYLANQGCA